MAKVRLSTRGLFTRRVFTKDWSIWDRYGVAFAILLAALVSQHWLLPERTGIPFLVFFFAEVTCALFFDLVTALLAVVLSGFALAFFFIEPVRSFLIGSGSERNALAAFILVSVICVVVIEGLHRLIQDQSARKEEGTHHG